MRPLFFSLLMVCLTLYSCTQEPQKVTEQKSQTADTAQPEPTVAATIEDEREARGEEEPPGIMDEYQAMLHAAAPLNHLSDNILDHFFLVRPPDFLSREEAELASQERVDAVLIIGPEEEPSSVHEGDVFFVVNEKGETAKGILTTIINSSDVDEESFNYEKVPLGILVLEKEILWGESPAAAAGIKEFQPKGEDVGASTDLSSSSVRKESKIILENLSIDDVNYSHDCCKTWTVSSLKHSYEHLSVFYSNPNADQKLFVEWPMVEAGFLFVRMDGNIIPVDSLHTVKRIFSITDINNDGVVEVVTSEHGRYGGDYMVRLLEKDKLIQHGKVLYRWAD